jgi:sugar/nucleoside kinase (ribokinase family)
VQDVYAYGVIAPSTLIELDGRFPPEAGYAEIGSIHPSFGGEAAGSAYVLARLGVTTKLSGNRLGSDRASQRVIGLLSAAGVDCSTVARDADPPVTEIVFSTERERTVFGTYGKMRADQAWTEPSRDDIRSSRIVCLDPFFGDASDSAARWCREVGVPYVTVDANPDSEIARHAEALIISEEFAERTSDGGDPRDLLDTYLGRCRGLVILTRGSRPLFYGRPGGPPRQFAPFSVEARDTAGAGDSFRAGVIYGLLQQHSDERIVTTASAVAAIVCQASPGVLHSPTERQLEEFLEVRL